MISGLEDFSKSTEEKNRDIVRKRLEPYRLKLLDHVTNYVPEKRIISEVYESKDICCLVFDIGKKKQYSTEYFSENIFNYNSPILEEFKNEIQSLVNDKVIQKDYLTKDMGSLFIRELAYLKYFYRFFDVNYCSIYHVVEVNIETSETLRIGEKEKNDEERFTRRQNEIILLV